MDSLCPKCHQPVDEKLINRRGEALSQALQIEVSSYHFYHRLSEAIDDPELADFFDNLSQMEQGHAQELDRKYHLHLSLEELFKDSGLPLRQPFFEDLCFLANRDDLHRLFDCAINLEKKTHNYFVAKVKEFPEGAEKELYKELAAEELDHISLLESMRNRGRSGRT